MSDTDSDQEIADVFVNSEELFPDRHGAVPLYSDHPPDTHLPMWRCPCCHEPGPTMRDLWQLYKRRERLLDLQNEYDYPSEGWTAYNEGIQETNRRISRITWALPSEVAGWIRKQVDPRKWPDSDLNPATYRDGDIGDSPNQDDDVFSASGSSTVVIDMGNRTWEGTPGEARSLRDILNSIEFRD